MSWTVACFCGTVFTAPADCCPTCHSTIPTVVIAARVSHNAQLPDAVEELLRLSQRSD